MMKLGRKATVSATLTLVLGCGGRASTDPASGNTGAAGGRASSGGALGRAGGMMSSGGQGILGGARNAGGAVGAGGRVGSGGAPGFGGVLNNAGGVAGLPFSGGYPNAGGVAGVAGAPMGGAAGAAGAGGVPVSEMPSCQGLVANCGPNANEDCCTSLLVPGGTFNRANDPNYPATVSDFRLDKYEVTVGRFRKFVEAYDAWRAAGHPLAGEGEHPLIPGTGWDVNWSASLPADAAGLRAALKCLNPDFPYEFYTWTDAKSSGESRPINCLNWYEASAFCAWDTGRLATETEWEYAATGGNEQRIYPWGSADPGTMGEYAAFNCYGNGDMMCRPSDIVRVGSSPAGNGRWGNADLDGNLSEWTFDWEWPYGATCVNCARTLITSSRTLRGGGWTSSPYDLPVFGRGNLPPVSRGDGLGARCARWSVAQ